MRLTGGMLRACAKSPISLIIIFLISTDLSILLDIPVFRQILSFIFLAFVPGALFLCILKPDKLGLTEKFVLSVGLSISFIMFIGILINTLYPLFGYETPLSTISLLTSLSAALLILTVIAHFRGGFAFFAKRTDLRLDTADKAFVLIPIIFLPLSIFGMHIMNTADNNAMLMALLLLIPSYVAFVSIRHNQVSENVYPTIIFLSSLSLVLLWGMRSSHIIGTDVHLEYIIFKQTFLNEKWQILQYSTLDSCLSISILPTTFQSFINVNSEYLFKILYPLLFSISPLVVYLITKNYLCNISAFLAAVFFMSQTFFIITTASPRTNIAILFFALSIMVLLHSIISELNKKILMIIFIFSSIVSHYSSTYVFFITVLITLVCVQLIQRLIFCKARVDIKNFSLTKKNSIAYSTAHSTALSFSKPYFTRGTLAIFFVALFLWYSQVTGTAFDSGVGFIANTIDKMQDFFIEESRDSGIYAAFGAGLNEKPLLSKAIFVICWLPNIFIFIGILTTLVGYHQRVALPYENSYIFPDFLSKKLDVTFFALGQICFAILVATVALPYVTQGYDLGRILLQMMVVLSSFLIFGGLELARIVRTNRFYLIILLVIIPFFILNTGALHSILGDPNTVILSSQGMSYDTFYIQEQDAYACKWLGKNIELGTSIYTDPGGKRRLLSQGSIAIKYIKDIAPILMENRNIYGYIYLKYSNVIDRKIIIDKTGEYLNLNEHWYRFLMKEKFYDNGGSEIWR